MTSLLEVSDLKVYYKTKVGYVRAVDDVSLTVNRNEVVGLAGESGCGKTTIALSILKILPPEARILGGKIVFDGEDILRKSYEEMNKVRWEKISMIFQGAMNALNPVITVGEQISDAISAHRKVSKKEALERARELFEMVGINPDRVNNYPHEFSGGMRQRVIIAMALALNPQLIIADEPTTGLDVITQGNILETLRNLQKSFKLSILLITHDLSVIAQNCHRVAIMYAGKIVEMGGVESIFKDALHPYTYLLVRAFPSVKGGRRRLKSIPGAVPNLLDPPSGCRFHPRCPYAKEICRLEEPKLIHYSGKRLVACHLPGQFEREL